MIDNSKKWVIFDLDGTLANIETRRKLATIRGKMDWDIFFSDILIQTDEPNQPVIDTCRALDDAGYKIAIFSGRSASAKQVTTEWLRLHGVRWDILRMRPTENKWKFMPDEKLKLQWLNEMDWKEDVMCVFDDRQKVVDMWREIGLTCMQVAPGNF
jgi:phosphoglycolate phosphatase-like HAD superfamily hydrolase